MEESKFVKGDYVFLKPFEDLCEINGLSKDNEGYKKIIDYISSKEDLMVSKVYKPGELTYTEDSDVVNLRNKKTSEYMYNIQTPRSKLYLFSEDELILNKEKERYLFED